MGYKFNCFICWKLLLYFNKPARNPTFCLETKSRQKIQGRNEYGPFLPNSYLHLQCYCGFCICNSIRRRSYFITAMRSFNFCYILGLYILTSKEILYKSVPKQVRDKLRN